MRKRAGCEPVAAWIRWPTSSVAASPRCPSSTRDLATIFSQMSPTIGLTVTGDAIFRVLERDQTDVWTGGGMTYTAAGGGFVYPTSLSASDRRR